jgi:hypothetical protein
VPEPLGEGLETSVPEAGRFRGSQARTSTSGVGVDVLAPQPLPDHVHDTLGYDELESF